MYPVEVVRMYEDAAMLADNFNSVVLKKNNINPMAKVE
jgi:hypothetical protein